MTLQARIDYNGTVRGRVLHSKASAIFKSRSVHYGKRYTVQVETQVAEEKEVC